MFDLTPGERRGALIVLALFALGTLWDVTHREPVMAPAVPARLQMTASAGDAGTDSAAALPGADANAGAVGAAPAPMPAPARRGKSPPAQPLPLASATAADLARLPGIGPVLARRIVERREAVGGFRAVDDLLAVPGIGPRLFARIRPWLRVDASVQSARPR